jgi:hypothetical protein
VSEYAKRWPKTIGASMGPGLSSVMERFRRAGTPIPLGFGRGASLADLAADRAGSQKKSRGKRLL